MRKKMQRKLAELKEELRERMHTPIREVGKWLRSVLLGHYRYYGVPRNSRRLGAFRYHLLRIGCGRCVVEVSGIVPRGSE